MWPPKLQEGKPSLPGEREQTQQALTPNPEEHVTAWPPGTGTVGWPGPVVVLADGCPDLTARQACEPHGDRKRGGFSWGSLGSLSLDV